MIRPTDCPWFVFYLTDGARVGLSEGRATMSAAFTAAVARLEANEATRFVIFAGQPHDGAPVVCRVNLSGMPDGATP